MLSLTGLGALAVNPSCASILARYRGHAGSLTRAAFLSARNDAHQDKGTRIRGHDTYPPIPIPLDVAGAGVLTAFTYDSFGRRTLLTRGNGAASAYGYDQLSRQIWIPELAMYHYKARAYSPTLGRFLQTDPAGYGAGMNLYAYTGDDPVNMVDPSGMTGTGDSGVLAESIGVAVTSGTTTDAFGSTEGPSEDGSESRIAPHRGRRFLLQ